MSAILGIGAGVGIVAGAVIVEQLSWQWMFWLPLVLIVVSSRMHVAVRSRIACACPGSDQLDGRRADEHGHYRRAARDQRDNELGLGLAADARPARRRPACLLRSRLEALSR